MAKITVDDDLWALVEPLLPQHAKNPIGGRPWADDRSALSTIIFVLRTGCQWQAVRRDLFPVSGSTAWRRLRDWQRLGVWSALFEVLLANLHGAGKIDWSRASVDSSTVQAKGRGEKTGPSPVDRGRPGSKHHIIVDRCGTPLAPPMLTPANTSDSPTLPQMLDRIRPVRGRRGRPRRRPRKLHADKGYDARSNRLACRRRRVIARIARRGVESKTRLGKHRWVVERTWAWLHSFRRLLVRYDRLAMVHQAFLTLAACLVCWNVMQRPL